MADLKITVKALKDQFNVNVSIGKYTPGDGWTRYSVSVNDWTDIKQGMTAGECKMYVQGLYDMLRVQWDESKAAKRESLMYLCAVCGKSGPDHGHYDATDPNTHKFVCGELVPQP